MKICLLPRNTTLYRFVGLYLLDRYMNLAVNSTYIQHIYNALIVTFDEFYSDNINWLWFWSNIACDNLKRNKVVFIFLWFIVITTFEYCIILFQHIYTMTLEFTNKSYSIFNFKGSNIWTNHLLNNINIIYMFEFSIFEPVMIDFSNIMIIMTLVIGKTINHFAWNWISLWSSIWSNWGTLTDNMNFNFPSIYLKKFEEWKVLSLNQLL